MYRNQCGYVREQPEERPPADDIMFKHFGPLDGNSDAQKLAQWLLSQHRIYTGAGQIAETDWDKYARLLQTGQKAEAERFSEEVDVTAWNQHPPRFTGHGTTFIYDGSAVTPRNFNMLYVLLACDPRFLLPLDSDREPRPRQNFKWIANKYLRYLPCDARVSVFCEQERSEIALPIKTGEFVTLWKSCRMCRAWFDLPLDQRQGTCAHKALIAEPAVSRS